MNSHILMLVNVGDDHSLLQGRAGKFHEQQQISTRTIGGKLYYQLKCTIVDLLHLGHRRGYSIAIRGEYTRKQSVGDVDKGQGGFKVRFDGTDYVQHVNWMWIVNNPSRVRV